MNVDDEPLPKIGMGFLYLESLSSFKVEFTT